MRYSDPHTERFAEAYETEHVCATCKWWKRNERFPNRFGTCTLFTPNSLPHPVALTDSETYEEFGCISWQMKERT